MLPTSRPARQTALPAHHHSAHTPQGTMGLAVKPDVHVAGPSLHSWGWAGQACRGGSPVVFDGANNFRATRRTRRCKLAKTQAMDDPKVAVTPKLSVDTPRSSAYVIPDRTRDTPFGRTRVMPPAARRRRPSVRAEADAHNGRCLVIGSSVTGRAGCRASDSRSVGALELAIAIVVVGRSRGRHQRRGLALLIHKPITADDVDRAGRADRPL